MIEQIMEWWQLVMQSYDLGSWVVFAMLAGGPVVTLFVLGFGFYLALYAHALRVQTEQLDAYAKNLATERRELDADAKKLDALEEKLERETESAKKWFAELRKLDATLTKERACLGAQKKKFHDARDFFRNRVSRLLRKTVTAKKKLHDRDKSLTYREVEELIEQIEKILVSSLNNARKQPDDNCA